LCPDYTGESRRETSDANSSLLRYGPAMSNVQASGMWTFSCGMALLLLLSVLLAVESSHAELLCESEMLPSWRRCSRFCGNQRDVSLSSSTLALPWILHKTVSVPWKCITHATRTLSVPYRMLYAVCRNVYNQYLC